MSSSHHDDDLGVEKTEGFKVGEKKTVEEYLKTGKDAYIRLNLSTYFRIYVAFTEISPCFKASDLMLDGIVDCLRRSRQREHTQLAMSICFVGYSNLRPS